jgi:hypothetical protein
MKRNSIKSILVLTLLAVLLVTVAGLAAGCGSEEAKDNGTVTAGQEDGDGTATNPGDSTQDNDGGTQDSGTSTGGSQDSGGTPSDSGSGGTDTTPAAQTVTIQIQCKLLLGVDLTDSGLAPLVPGDGILLSTTKVTLEEGDTVYDLTRRITREKTIHFSTLGTPELGTLYVEAIGNIYEKAYNSKSGWVYLVNGTKPSTSCGLYELKAGDVLVWAYSLDLGNDL